MVKKKEKTELTEEDVEDFINAMRAVRRENSVFIKLINAIGNVLGIVFSITSLAVLVKLVFMAWRWIL